MDGEEVKEAESKSLQRVCGFSLPVSGAGGGRTDVKSCAEALTSLASLFHWSSWPYPEHTHIKVKCMQGNSWLSSPGTRKPQAGFPWTQQDPSEAAWPVMPSTWSPSSSLPWTHGPGKKAACGTSVTPTLLRDRSACCASQTELAEARKGAASPAAGFLHFKQHMQIKLARVPLHLRSSSASLPNNSQAKLTQFDIKIKFIFRGIHFPYPSVSVDAFSVWPDKHTSTLSPDPLNPSDSHLTVKRPSGVELMYIQMVGVSPSPYAAEEGLYMLGPFFSTCLPVLRLVSGSLEPEKPYSLRWIRAWSQLGSAESTGIHWRPLISPHDKNLSLWMDSLQSDGRTFFIPVEGFERSLVALSPRNCSQNVWLTSGSFLKTGSSLKAPASSVLPASSLSLILC